MKYSEAVRLLEENPNRVIEAQCSVVAKWIVRMSVVRGTSRYFHFEVLDGDKVIDQSLPGGGFNGNVALELDWHLVRQVVTWHEAIQAWLAGRKVSYSYMGCDKRFVFEDSNAMMSIEKVKNAEWYVEE